MATFCVLIAAFVGTTASVPRLYTEFGKVIVSAEDVTLRTRDGDVTASDMMVIRSDLEGQIETSQNDATIARNTLKSMLESALNTTKMEASSDIESLNSRMDDEISTTMSALKATDTANFEATTKMVADLKTNTDTARNSLNTHLTGKLTAQTQALDSKLDANMKKIQGQLSTTSDKTLSTIVALEARVKKTEQGLVAFQMPKMKWKQSGTGAATKCEMGQHGQLRRIEGKTATELKSIVHCNGKEWQRIAPLIGKNSENRLPGGGCVMRDVHSFQTGSSNCRTVMMKTNIKVRSSTMFTIDLHGYNYGPSTHVKNSITGYTYSGWSCAGSISRRNYGNAGSIDYYCSNDGYIVISMYVGNSYYLGFSMDASFLNPTGDHMCGKFEVTATKCNSRY